jgi:CcmD family protein
MTSALVVYAIAWTILMGYALSLGSRQREIRRGLDTLRAELRQK